VDTPLLGETGLRLLGVARALATISNARLSCRARGKPLTARSDALQTHPEPRVRDTPVGEGAARAFRTGLVRAVAASKVSADGDAPGHTLLALGAAPALASGDAGGAIEPLLAEEPFRAIQRLLKAAWPAAPASIAAQPRHATVRLLSQPHAARCSLGTLALEGVTAAQGQAAADEPKRPAVLAGLALRVHFARAVQA
jgi:hypothetical protein